MKPITKIICCIATLSWISSATAGATQRVPVPVHYVKAHDQVQVETKIDSNANLTKKRKDEAQKGKAARDSKKKKP